MNAVAESGEDYRVLTNAQFDELATNITYVHSLSLIISLQSVYHSRYVSWIRIAPVMPSLNSKARLCDVSRMAGLFCISLWIERARRKFFVASSTLAFQSI